MKRVVVAAAAALVGAGAAVSMAKAEMNPGPVQDKGLCFTKSSGQDPATFGYWAECPKPAAAPAAAPATHRHPAKHSAKSAQSP